MHIIYVLYISCVSMSSEIAVFIDLSWDKKIEYLTGFYQSMIHKTKNPLHIAQFEKVLGMISSSVYSEDNEKKLVWLYQKIMQAKEQTKTRKLARTAVKIAQEREKINAMKDEDSAAEADVMLAEALFDMWL